MTSIASELSKVIKIEYLESMSASELAFWLIHSFSPERYHDKDDIIKEACGLFAHKVHDSKLAIEFVNRLWSMFGQVQNNVIDLRSYR